MRFGIAFVPGMPYQRVIELAREAEALGYDDLYLPDQTFHRDPFALLALCAEATERIRLGLAVTNPYTRHPVQVARAAGLLAEVSEGRFVLGLGAGNKPRVLAGFGIPQTDVLARLREAVDVIRRLLAGETLTFRSPTLELNDVHLDFEPVYPVRIALASRAPGVLALAGEVADGAMLEGLFTSSALEWALGRVAAGASRAGRPVDDVETVAWQALVLDDDPQLAAQDRLRRWAAFLVHTTRPEVLAEIGVAEETIRAVAQDVARRGGVGEPSGAGVRAEDVAKLLLMGGPLDLLKQVSRLDERGVSAIACILFGDPDEIGEKMRRFAEEVVAQARPS
jgi:5,10-methylenetetrahydromethanopterin reductase